MITELIALKRTHLIDMGETDAMQNELRMAGPGLCLLCEGTPVAAGGVVRLWDDVGKAWSLLTERAVSSPLIMRRIHKAVGLHVPLLRDAMKFQRLEAETPADRKYCAWLLRHGFTEEGLMRRYKAGQDFVRFAWLR